MLEKMKGIAARGGIVGTMLGGLTMLSFVLADGSFAEDTTDASSDITSFGTTVATYGAAVIGVVLVGAGIVLAIKYLRKAASHA